MTVVIIIPVTIGLLLSRRRHWRSITRTFRNDALLNNLVEFAAIQPYTSTLGAIINLDALSLTHYQIDLAFGAEKAVSGTIYSCFSEFHGANSFC